jgi:flagellar motor switch protein FliG
MIQKIDIDKLVATIKKEEPSTIALFLSYLDPTRAEKVITSLPDKIQEEVYVHLSEIEKQHV